ncbi:MAG: hypothetical protein IPO83_18790 [Chitinophagaceae bacterium]|nr:hypothetical protein [Chitinophagaceae bacterium]
MEKDFFLNYSELSSILKVTEVFFSQQKIRICNQGKTFTSAQTFTRVLRNVCATGTTMT